MNIAVFSTKYYEREYMDKANADARHDLTYFDIPLNAGTAVTASGFDAVCVQLSDKVDKETIMQLSKAGIRLIALRSAGFDNVDIEASAQHSITVVRVPAYSPQAIAEHAVALILTLDRKTHKAYNRVRENNFSLQGLLGFNLSGKTVGVVGTGKIGTAFCTIMLGFGCRVIACDIKQSDDLKRKGVTYESFDYLLQNSDMISIHCPLNPGTRHLFNAVAFSGMKAGMMLINTSRGAILNSPDAIDALKSGQLGYLGIDVYEGEESLFFKDLSENVVQDDTIERLMSFNNVLITPHQAFFTVEALDQIAKITIANFTAFESMKPLENEVLPS
jgi:D-lactate dehydrogenase